jgi:hypothetical protein
LDSRDSKRLRGAERFGLTVSAVVAVLLPAAGLFVAAQFRYHYRCDEACQAGAGWTRSLTGWEWAVQFWCFAVPGVIAATLVVGFSALGHTRRAGVALAVSLASVVAYLLFPSVTGG